MNKFADAVDVVCDRLKNDPELFYAYQANIAMAFYDEYRREGNNLSYEKVHLVANRAAANFLKTWINHKPAQKNTKVAFRSASDNNAMLSCHLPNGVTCKYRNLPYSGCNAKTQCVWHEQQ